MILKRIMDALPGRNKSSDVEKPRQEVQKPDYSEYLVETPVKTTRGPAVLQFGLMAKLSQARERYADDPESLAEYEKLYQRAENYLLGFNWHRKLLEVWNGLYADGILSVFLFKIEPVSEEIDEWMWVVVGDIPSAVIMIDKAPHGPAALAEYVDAMREWVDAARNGEPVDDLIPVNVPPTPEWAEELDSRLNFISKKILVEYATYIKR